MQYLLSPRHTDEVSEYNNLCIWRFIRMPVDPRPMLCNCLDNNHIGIWNEKQRHRSSRRLCYDAHHDFSVSDVRMRPVKWSIPDSNRWPLQCESTQTPFQGFLGRSYLKLSYIICARIWRAYHLHRLHQEASKIDTNCGRNCGQLFGVNEILRCGWILTGKTMTETTNYHQICSQVMPRLLWCLTWNIPNWPLSN